jgi:hypothetical protein
LRNQRRKEVNIIENQSNARRVRDFRVRNNKATTSFARLLQRVTRLTVIFPEQTRIMQKPAARRHSKRGHYALFFAYLYLLVLVNRFNRADFRTVAAVNTGFGIDDIFVFPFGNSVNRAFGFAGAAGNAVIINYMCHIKTVLSIGKMYTFTFYHIIREITTMGL